MSIARKKSATKSKTAKSRAPAKKPVAKKAPAARRSRPPSPMLTATCYLAGPGPHQDAFFVLLRDNTVRTLIHEGGISGHGARIESSRAAHQLVVSLLGRGWQVVMTPRRTEHAVEADMAQATRAFLARKTRRVFQPDPDANTVPPARELARQQERATMAAAKVLPGSRPLPGGAVETKRRKH